jgi:ABC-2 type transport system permease protein
VNGLTETVRETQQPPRGPAAFSGIRLLEWSIRRELWENRSIYAAPLSVAAVMLHGERRDRSILFWKSLPVSDWTTVLAKLSVPVLILPLLSFVIIVGAQLFLLLLSSAVLAGSGFDAASIWPQGKVIPSPPAMLVAVAVTALWHAPIYAWLLLVSGWARRAVFLWAFLPFLVASVFERMAFHTTFIGSLLRHRLAGWWGEAFVPAGRGHMSMKPLTQVHPEEYLGRPGMWIGLALAVALVAAAVRLRRDREPL